MIFGNAASASVPIRAPTPIIISKYPNASASTSNASRAHAGSNAKYEKPKSDAMSDRKTSPKSVGALVT